VLIRVGAGTPFDRLGWHTVRGGWGGLEWATGIPGTVGGAVFMNAGAHGSCAWDALEAVEYLTKDGTLHVARWVYAPAILSTNFDCD
jgi:UDP-N-acetylmuramate dehydrogenase